MTLGPPRKSRGACHLKTSDYIPSAQSPYARSQELGMYTVFTWEEHYSTDPRVLSPGRRRPPCRRESRAPKETEKDEH